MSVATAAGSPHAVLSFTTAVLSFSALTSLPRRLFDLALGLGMGLVLVLALGSAPVHAQWQKDWFPDHLAATEDAQRFAQEMQTRHGLDANAILHTLEQMNVNKQVLKLIAPPSRSGQRSWQRYRSRFINERNVERGLDFWRQNRAAFVRAEAIYGVPAEVVLGIIGVETSYGRIMGNFKVAEALATLAFHYPRRAAFFRSELEQFFLMCRENQLSAPLVKGSFAGAFGIPQFMPGSLRRFAVDFDHDGKIDLINSPEDAIGSVANFLLQHGWQSGGTVAVRAQIQGATAEQVQEWLEMGIQPRLNVGELRAAGVLSRAADQETVALIDLVTPDEASEYWLGMNNFYTITRYNRSSFYAMSVFQLSQAIKTAMRANPR